MSQARKQLISAPQANPLRFNEDSALLKPFFSSDTIVSRTVSKRGWLGVAMHSDLVRGLPWILEALGSRQDALLPLRVRGVEDVDLEVRRRLLEILR